MPSKKIKSADIALTEADVAVLVGQVAELQVQHDVSLAKMNEQLDAIRRAFEPEIAALATDLQAKSLQIEAWVRANATRFQDPRSRAFARGEIGLQLGKWAVITLRGVTQKTAVKRLLRFRWGKKYIRQPDPVLDKNALLRDRTEIKPERLLAAGLAFEQDETFFIKPALDEATAPLAAE